LPPLARQRTMSGWNRRSALLHSEKMPPPTDEPVREKTLQEVVQELDLYPIEAFDFVLRGLGFTVKQLHGDVEVKDPKHNRHVSGGQLCLGLRELALKQWGMMAPAVLGRWGVKSTLDFGRIVFAMIDGGYMQKTETDRLEDFRAVYDFNTAFHPGFKVELT
jgi:uncharacterized repeat protein (TIGR04138 family)